MSPPLLPAVQRRLGFQFLSYRCFDMASKRGYRGGYRASNRQRERRVYARLNAVRHAVGVRARLERSPNHKGNACRF